jgi:hypothetical protein
MSKPLDGPGYYAVHSAPTAIWDLPS